MAAPRALRRGTRRSISARLPGTSSAAPTPCTARAAISARRSGAAPHAAEASANSATPARNTFRRPHRSPSAPPTSTSDGEQQRIRLDDPLQLARPSPPGSRCMTGSATFTTVPSRKAIPEPRIATTSAQRGSFAEGGVEAGSGIAGTCHEPRHLAAPAASPSCRLRGTKRGVAQPGSASALGAECRRFKSSRPDRSRSQTSFADSEGAKCRIAHLSGPGDSRAGRPSRSSFPRARGRRSKSG